MPVAEYGSLLTFDEQIEFFRGKRPIPTERWNDLWRDAHDRGFMVAGAMKDELLADLSPGRQSLNQERRHPGPVPQGL